MTCWRWKLLGAPGRKVKRPLLKCQGLKTEEERIRTRDQEELERVRIKEDEEQKRQAETAIMIKDSDKRLRNGFDCKLVQVSEENIH